MVEALESMRKLENRLGLYSANVEPLLVPLYRLDESSGGVEHMACHEEVKSRSPKESWFSENLKNPKEKLRFIREHYKLNRKSYDFSEN